LSVAETAKILGYSKQQIYEMVKRRDIRHCKYNARITIPEDAIAEFIAKHTVPTLGR
jgi:excisionase family DNA binding protein